MTRPSEPYVAFASYGNDSLALVQYLSECGAKDVTVLFSDTGWAAPWWEHRVEKAEAWVRGLGYTPAKTQSKGMERLVKERKGWPRQGQQFCTLELKIIPAWDWLEENDPLGLTCAVVGVRREESRNRASYPEYVSRSEVHGDRSCWTPLVDHTEEDRDALLHRAGWEPLPHRSMECSPCINSNRADLRALGEDAIQRVERIEGEMGHTAKGKPRTMFRPYRHMKATGIREVVRWAHSDKGKFNPGQGAGCSTGWCGS